MLPDDAMHRFPDSWSEDVRSTPAGLAGAIITVRLRQEGVTVACCA